MTVQYVDMSNFLEVSQAILPKGEVAKRVAITSVHRGLYLSA
ncbi:MAG: hypothetical protein ACI955_000267 [Zhongshania sp.]|jgi:hypothetical protein